VSGQCRVTLIAACLLSWVGASAPDRAAARTLQPSRLIFDVNYTGNCGSNYCDIDYFRQFASLGRGRFRQIEPPFGLTPGFTRDGRRVAYADEEERLIVSDARGNDRRIIARDIGFAGYESTSASWSPGGQRIAFTDGNGAERPAFVMTIRPDGRGLRRLAEGEQPAWSPNGKVIAFVRFSPPAAPQMFTVPASGGRERPFGTGSVPDWSRRGDALTYARDGRIWVARGDGTHGRELGAGYLPRFSPDGGQIAFVNGLSAGGIDRDGTHRHLVAALNDLDALDPRADEGAAVTWVGWQPLP
jgi:dipeptidyl aminopeptidase/acylaminoacyl peptidase